MTSKAQSAIIECFKSGEYSDLMICCGTREFQVHKNVVCPQSELFATAVKEGRFKEGQTGVIEFPAAHDPDAIKAMLDFLYTGDFEIPDSNPFRPATPSLAIAKAETLKRTSSESTQSTAEQSVVNNNWGFGSGRGGRDSGRGMPSSSAGRGGRGGRGGYHGGGPPNSAFVMSPVAAIATTGSSTPVKFTFTYSGSQKHPLLFLLAVYELADRLRQIDLEKLTETKITTTAAETASHAQFAVQKAYNITPPGKQGDKLRSTMIKTATANAAVLFKNVKFVHMLGNILEFAEALGAALDHVHRKDNQEELECAVCDFSFSIKRTSEDRTIYCPGCSNGESIKEWR